MSDERDLMSASYVRGAVEELLQRNMNPSDRVNKIAGHFNTLDRPNAEWMLEMIGETAGDPSAGHFSRLFHSRLLPKDASYLLDILRRRATISSSSEVEARRRAEHARLQGDMPKSTARLYRMRNEDRGVDYQLSQYELDGDTEGIFIDHQIHHVTSDYDKAIGARTTMVVHYNNGRSLIFQLKDVPITWRYVNPPKGSYHVRLLSNSTLDHYVLRGGFIYPIDVDGDVILSSRTTPNLIKFRSALEAQQQNRDRALELAYMVNAFAAPIASLAGVASITSQNRSLFITKTKAPSDKLNVRPLARTSNDHARPAKTSRTVAPAGPTRAPINGKPDATDPAHAAREQLSAEIYSKNPNVKEVHLGAAAKEHFKSPAKEKFPDVVATNKDGSVSLGEGKGTDMNKTAQQFKAAGERIAQPVRDQHVVVDQITMQQGERSPGPGHRVDASNLLERFNESTTAWERVIVNGQPIRVIEASKTKP